MFFLKIFDLKEKKNLHQLRIFRHIHQDGELPDLSSCLTSTMATLHCFWNQ